MLLGKMIIKRRPQKTTPSSENFPPSSRRRPNKYQEPFAKTSTQPGRTYRPNLDYDYYDDEDVRLVGNKSDQQVGIKSFLQQKLLANAVFLSRQIRNM